MRELRLIEIQYIAHKPTCYWAQCSNPYIFWLKTLGEQTLQFLQEKIQTLGYAMHSPPRLLHHSLEPLPTALSPYTPVYSHWKPLRSSLGFILLCLDSSGSSILDHSSLLSS